MNFSLGAGETKQITIDHSEQVGTSFVSVWAKPVSGAGQRLNSLFALSTDPKVPPTGWELAAGGIAVVSAIVGENAFTVTIDDGGTIRFDRQGTSDTYVGPPGNSDTVSRTVDGRFVFVSGRRRTPSKPPGCCSQSGPRLMIGRPPPQGGLSKQSTAAERSRSPMAPRTWVQPGPS